MWKKHGTKIIIGVVVLIILIGAGFFVLSKNNAPTTEDQTVSDNTVQTLSPSDIGLKLEASSDNHKVRYTISNASDIKTIEYELTYNANATAEEQSEGADDQVQRGITGTATVNSGSGSYQSSWLILGSQSANVVRYDKGVKSVSITLKITKSNGKVYQVQDKINL
jgi:hypothetical protein